MFFLWPFLQIIGLYGGDDYDVFLCFVAVVDSSEDVSEKHTASIFRAEGWYLGN
jgi:hypothetical protein